MAMDQISKDDANLLTAEGTFEWLFDELQKINSAVSLELLEGLKVELDVRRKKDIVSLLKFLQNPKSLFETNKEPYFDMPPKKEVYVYATTVWNKYFKGSAIAETSLAVAAESQPSQLDRSDEDFSAASRLGLAIGK